LGTGGDPIFHGFSPTSDWSILFFFLDKGASQPPTPSSFGNARELTVSFPFFPWRHLPPLFLPGSLAFVMQGEMEFGILFDRLFGFPFFWGANSSFSL